MAKGIFLMLRCFTLKKTDRQVEMENTSLAASFLGIECGGTRSIAIWAPGGDQPNIRAEFGPCNLRLLNDEQLVEHFTKIQAQQPLGAAKLTGIAIGIAGARTEADRARIRAAAAKVWPKVPCYATNDLETALVAGESSGKSKPAARVLILSGTGSCCFGRTSDRKTLRYGGWGHIIGDKASGYEIGLRGLKASVHCLDRDGKWSVLGQHLLHALELNEPNDFIDWAKNADKSEIAALAIQVFGAAAAGDKIAKDILAGAAASLAQDGAACAGRLVKKGSPVEFILSGSVLLKQPGFVRDVKKQLVKLWPKATVVPLERESIWGALELAKEHFGAAKGSAPKDAVVVCRTEIDAAIVPVSKALSPTEQRNPRSINLDRLPLAKAIELMIEEDANIPKALYKERQHIEKAVALIVKAFKCGGRLFYIGAGTSGRLGVLDASECPPTFRTPPERVQGIIAGGQRALWRSAEGAEDDSVAGATAIEYRGVNKRDVVIGIATSGRTPYVWGAIAEAKKRGASTVFLCFNPHLDIPKANKPDVVIAPDVGPEILTGSTRLKAGTATKLVLNILTTVSMVRMGKVVSNLMVDLNASNKKLRERAIRIVQAITGANATAAHEALEKSKWMVKAACQRLR